MLSEEERKEIQLELVKHAKKRGAGPEALRILQRHRGWTSPEGIQDIASMLDMSPDDLDSVGTCYNFVFEKPVGRHLIMVCDTVSCWMKGYEKIVEHLQRTLGITFGQTTPDGRFTLLPVACLGACDEAPAVMIDKTLYGHVDADRIDAILKNYQ